MAAGRALDRLAKQVDPETAKEIKAFQAGNAARLKAAVDNNNFLPEVRRMVAESEQKLDDVRAKTQNLGPVPTFAMRDNDPDRIEGLYGDEQITTVTATATKGKEMKSFAIMMPSEPDKTLMLGDRFEFTHDGQSYVAKIDRKPVPVDLGTGIRSIVEYTPDITVLRVDPQIFERPRAMTNQEIKDLSRGLPEV